MRKISLKETTLHTRVDVDTHSFPATLWCISLSRQRCSDTGLRHVTRGLTVTFSPMKCVSIILHFCAILTKFAQEILLRSNALRESVCWNMFSSIMCPKYVIWFIFLRKFVAQKLRYVRKGLRVPFASRQYTSIYTRSVIVSHEYCDRNVLSDKSRGRN